MKFGEKLQKLRKENGLSQEQLAEKLNVSRQAISKWEMGTIPDMENVDSYTLIKMKVSVIPCTGSIIFNTSFRSIIILTKYRCLSSPLMYVGIPIAQIWQNPE